MSIRRDALLSSGACTLAALLVLAGCAAPSRTSEQRPATSQRPNVVFVLADDLGWRDVGFMGSPYYETPHLDALAARGMVFTDAYANAPNCAPSRAALLSGQYAPRHGVFTVGSPWRGPKSTRRLAPPENNKALPLEVVTIAEALQGAGYATAHMGKWHLGRPGAAGPREQGFDVNVGGTQQGHPPTYFSPYDIETLPDGPKGEYLTNRLTDEAVQFIEDHRDRPFFLYLSHYAVHLPLEAPDTLVAPYRGKPSWHEQATPTYAAMVESVDQSVGRIVSTLERLNLRENTVVVFFSDNGGLGGYASAGLPGSSSVTDNRPLKGGKGQLYEGGIRVPMVVSWPGEVEPGSVSYEPVIGTDFYPTLLEITGAQAPPDQALDGRSLVPLLRQAGTFDREEALYWFFPAYLGAYGREGLRTAPAAAVREGYWKLIWFFEDDRAELYNLEGDVGEDVDLSEAMPETTRRLRERLRTWMDTTGAPLPEPNPAYDPAAERR